MNIQDLIIDDRERGIFRYHRSALTSPEILPMERERVFSRCWLYLGHESEVENPGDYRRRSVGGRPLFYTRTAEGDIRVFYNTCRHRGALICRQEKGNGSVFQCFYHAWTFNNRGDLIGVPDEEGYAAGFRKEDYGLLSPPRVEVYRGLIFVSYNPDVEPLVDYLAGAKEYVDMIMDQSEAGFRVVPGSNQYDIQANWKLLMENSIDQYHAFPTHKTFFDYMATIWPDVPRSSTGHGRELGNGHAMMEFPATAGRPIALWTPFFPEEMKEDMDQNRARLMEKYGETRAHRMTENHRNLFIYPNLVINDVNAITIRNFDPVAVDRMQVTAWHLVPQDDDGLALAMRLDSFLTFLGPGGFATPDDSEALETCQAGFAAKEVEWSDISRGTQRYPQAVDELQMRGFWRRWHADMLGLGNNGERPDTSDHAPEPTVTVGDD